MSEPFPKHRAFQAGVDLRGRDGGVAPTEKLDPLAELARLVGREDPFRDLFPSREAVAKAAPADRLPDLPRAPTPEAFDRFPGVQQPLRIGQASRPRDEFDDQAAPGALDDDESAFHAPLGQGQRVSFRLPVLPEEDQPGSSDGESHFAANRDEPPELNADLWAQGMPEPVSGDPLRFVPPVEDGAEASGSSRRRTVVVLAAVLALTAGGLGATFLIRGGNAGSASGEPPTIMADTGPAKIQPPDTSNQATGGDGNTALIEKSASDSVNNAKVVDTQERPVDLAQLPKAAATAVPQADDGRVAVTTAPAGTNANPFPEPRKVKTILIRPDGSVVGDTTTAAGAATEQMAPPPGATPLPTEPAARPATPKSTVRATATPKSSATPGDGVAAVKPKVVHAAPKPKPVQTADATPDTTASTTPVPSATSGSSGSFAVQLAAPPSEQEAKDVMARLQKKYSSELDGRAPSIRKADNKSVYRVRISNLSQDDAKALCGKLQAGGGSCFVVRN